MRLKAFKQWALDVGIWEASDVSTWKWTSLRPLFWRTPTNRNNRALANSLMLMLKDYHTDVTTAYKQGVSDGSMQAAEMLMLQQVPEEVHQKYLH